MISFMTSNPAVNPKTAWQAVVRRDPERDGEFVFAVRTTGVYCRPSCPARRPNRANVAFFATGAAARAAGFRACRRCRPDEEWTDPLVAAKAALEEAGGDQVTLDTLARRVGLSPAHLQRRFKARFGLSPKEFQTARRTARFRSALRNGGSVSRATYDAGYGSSSRAYEGSNARLGMTPGRFARGGAGLAIHYQITDSRFGRLLVAATPRGVAAVLLGESDPSLEGALRQEFPNAERTRVELGADDPVTALTSRVASEIAGHRQTDIPLDLIGTAFQERVWRSLQEIPRGSTRSYRAVARAVGQPRAVRAVASAIAKNRLAVMVPCHRVIREDGKLGGYRWGVTTKQQLLEAERAVG
jgi:AraC family transcriptional regulator of adaptative response/methylated-DNA-[protein]-cysteine methyltransferase